MSMADIMREVAALPPERMTPATGYQLVQLLNGVHAVRAAACGEVMHPVLGPAAEAETLCVNQLRLRDRMREHAGEFVIWDIGLGAAANALAALRATRDLPCPLRLVSFDNTLEPLAFALANAEALVYLRDYEPVVGKVVRDHDLKFQDGEHPVRWEICVGDFPTLLASKAAVKLPKPHAIFYDAFSPVKTPAMWRLPVFQNLFRLLDPQRPCALTTYSRSTMVRVTLLLAGFAVGRGLPIAEKEETTVAANRLELLDAPLDATWLERVRKSGGAEPLRESGYRQSPLAEESWRHLAAHPQFRSGAGESAGSPA